MIKLKYMLLFFWLFSVSFIVYLQFHMEYRGLKANNYEFNHGGYNCSGGGCIFHDPRCFTEWATKESMYDKRCFQSK